ncbi:hypothetical protein ABIE35_001104 [Paenarthrobacter sp. 4246]
MLVYFPQGASAKNWAHSAELAGEVTPGLEPPGDDAHEEIVSPKKVIKQKQPSVLRIFIGPPN